LKLSPTNLAKIRSLAIASSEEAGKLLMRYFRKGIAAREKAKSSLVTEADLASEALIKKKLMKAFPDFIFLGEESGQGAGKEDSPRWHVDPLDGTTNFVHGFPMFCVSIGLEWRGVPLVGVVHVPALGETFHGAKGSGAKWNRKPMKVSSRKNLSECLLTTGFAYLQDETKFQPEVARFQKVHLEARAVRRPGAAALDMAYVAAGIFDGFWERNLSSWDVCAGALLVEEAGGKVTDYSGNPFSLAKQEVLATNGKIHKEMCQLMG
jgi:myo-inositol-1(or 4)-monophosphatase